jgi:hypothetical protein
MIYWTIRLLIWAIPVVLKLIVFILYLHFIILRAALKTAWFLLKIPFFAIRAANRRKVRIRAIRSETRIAIYETQLWDHLRSN